MCMACSNSPPMHVCPCASLMCMARALHVYTQADLAGLPLAARKRLERERRAAVGSQLSMLPAPVNEYTIVMPTMPPEEPAEEDELEEDALDAEVIACVITLIAC